MYWEISDQFKYSEIYRSVLFFVVLNLYIVRIFFAFVLVFAVLLISLLFCALVTSKSLTISASGTNPSDKSPRLNTRFTSLLHSRIAHEHLYMHTCTYLLSLCSSHSSSHFIIPLTHILYGPIRQYNGWWQRYLQQFL